MADPDKIEKFKIVYSSYTEVNNLDRYEDSKAERGLQALAFITLSGVTIFAGSLYILTTLHKNPDLFLAEYIFFSIFIIFASAGTFLVLYGIKPGFNIPKDWKETSKKDDPKSIFFYERIYIMDEEKWLEYFVSNSTDQLLDKAISDLVYETHLIAKKISEKLRWTKWGFILYLLCVVSLLIMVITMVFLVLIIS